MAIVSLSPKNKQTLRVEWENFIKNGKKPTHIRPEISASWQRSRDWGVDPFLDKNCRLLPQAEISARLEENREVMDVIIPYMNIIYQAIKGLGYFIFVTDSQAWVLHAVGDNNILQDYHETLDFKIGVNWSEEVVGTTAVGIALAEKKPVSFIAEEKYCFVLKNRACAAVPIRKDPNKISAVLGLATNLTKVKRMDSYIFGLLLEAKRSIENKLQFLSTKEDLNIINSYYKAVFDNVSDAIITVNGEGIIDGINPLAAEMLSVNPELVLGKSAEEILGFTPLLPNSFTCPARFPQTHLENTRKPYICNWNSIPIQSKNKKNSGILLIGQKNRNEGRSNSCTLDAQYTFDDIIGESKEIKDLKALLKTAAQESITVLLVGKSGTGKELFAQAIHNASLRASKPFVAVNCGAIPRDLAESEIFGYVEGAFTGARKGGHQGKFQQAQGGTIFLDEIAEMPLELQIKLLRVLENRKIVPLGGTESIPLDIRVICATNKDLRAKVQSGEFRQDLYWRINALEVNIPPLSSRKEDILILADHFLQEYSQKRGIHYTLDKDALKLLIQYSWPGNGRQLKNVLERSTIFAKDGTIHAKDLPEYLLSTDNNFLEGSCFTLEKAEYEAIKKAVSESDGNLTKAAKILGIARNTLYSKMDKFKIERPNI